MLTITITNMSVKESYYADSGIPIEDGMAFSCAVISPSGKGISPQSGHAGPRKGIVVALVPGQTPDRTISYNVSYIYKFEEIGTYTITVNCPFDWPGGKKQIFDVVYPDGSRRQLTADERFTVVSNPLTIQIVPDKQ
jgi:hypothetical protein